MNRDSIAGSIVELGPTIRAKESLRDHLARTIANLAADGDTTSEDFDTTVALYQQTRTEIDDAQRQLRDLTDTD